MLRQVEMNKKTCRQKLREKLMIICTKLDDCNHIFLSAAL